MKLRIFIAFASLFHVATVLAEPRVFTNNEGKTIKAELIAVEEEKAILELSNAERASVPISSLSESDQKFVKSWWEENKDNFNQLDFTLSIDKNRKQLSKSDSGNKGGKPSAVKKKISTEEIKFDCELKSFTKRDVTDLSVDYTIYKRVITRGDDGSEITTEEIDGSAPMKSLEGHGSATFETVGVVCEDSYEKGKDRRKSKRETVIGFVVTMSTGGKEFFKKSDPENFIERLEEEREREEALKDD